MTKPLLMICVLVLFISPSFAQDTAAKEAQLATPEETEMVNQLNSRLLAMQVALSGTQDLEADLELIDYQKTKLAILRSDYKEMFLSLKEYEKDDNMQKALASCLTTMDSFEHRLSSDILLPHQSTALQAMVFTKLMKEKGGDLISTLAAYYPKQFSFTDTQKKRLDKIKTSTEAKVAEAKREFHEKLKKIGADAKREVHTMLTPQQSQMLTELSDAP